MLKTAGLGALLEVECRKSARRCGAKHIWKSKVLKTGGLGALLEVEMSKKCTALWREAHFEVKSVKTASLGDFFDVQTSFCVVGGVDCVSTEK